MLYFISIQEYKRIICPNYREDAELILIQEKILVLPRIYLARSGTSILSNFSIAREKHCSLHIIET